MTPLNIKDIIPTIIGNSGKGQDGIFKYIIDHIGSTNKYCVEFGATNGINASNTWYFKTILKWDGIGFDRGQENHSLNVIRINLTRENICDVFKTHNVPREFDILSVDVDGNDYWLLSALLKNYCPRIINTEINARFHPYDLKVLKYNPNFNYNPAAKTTKGWYGASAYSFKLLGDVYGYTPVKCYDDELFLVRNDCLHPDDLNIAWESIYTPCPKIYDNDEDPIMNEEIWMDTPIKP